MFQPLSTRLPIQQYVKNIDYSSELCSARAQHLGVDIPISRHVSVLAVGFMKLGLRVSFLDGMDDYSSDRRLRFAVVDFDKADYPLNFVCMLPMQLKSEGYGNSKFAKAFGDESLAIAKKLLHGALETETASDVKVEIERRLRLLEPKQVVQIKCNRCGKLFQPRRVRRFHQNFCEECMKKRFGNRT